VVDVGSLCVDWDSVRLRPVHSPVVVVVDAKGSPDADVACTVTGLRRLVIILFSLYTWWSKKRRYQITNKSH